MAAQAKNKTILEEFMVGCKKVLRWRRKHYAGNGSGLFTDFVSEYYRFDGYYCQRRCTCYGAVWFAGCGDCGFDFCLFAKAAGAATAASLYADGIINAAQATILFPATITMGTLVGHFARCVLTAGTNPKHHAFCW